MMQLLDQLHTCNGVHLQVSPDGKSLAYLAPSEDKDVLNVWVRLVDSDNARMVTKDELRGIRYSTVASASYFPALFALCCSGRHPWYLGQLIMQSHFDAKVAQPSTCVISQLTQHCTYR